MGKNIHFELMKVENLRFSMALAGLVFVRPVNFRAFCPAGVLPQSAEKARPKDCAVRSNLADKLVE